jgi:hypothetical protein
MPPQPGAPTILVIEDDAKDRGWLTRTLAQAGYAVEPAATGAEALAKCRERAFDAVTLDLLLPDMTGWDVLRAIRTDGVNRDVPVIVVSVVAEKATAVGFAIQDFLVKPIEPESLLASLTQARVRPDGSKKVLVVDDDPKSLKLVEAMLARLGYEPICRDNGEAALGAVEAERPAAVVLDLLMPGMDGFAFLDRLRRIPGNRRTPVIVWTAKDLTAEDRARLRASAQVVVHKTEGGTAALMEQLEPYLPAAHPPAETRQPSGPAPSAGPPKGE